MSSYTSVFGGNTINPTMLSYATYTTAVDLDLVWQFEALDGSDVMAAKLDVVASVISLSVSFPKASLVSVGQDVLIRNTGVFTSPFWTSPATRWAPSRPVSRGTST